MISLKYQTPVLVALLVLCGSSWATDAVSESLADAETLKVLGDPHGGHLEAETKLFWSNYTSGDTTVIVSGAGTVWIIMWGVVIYIVGSAVLCYWVGCEYASTGRGLSDLTGLYVPLKTISICNTTLV